MMVTWARSARALTLTLTLSLGLGSLFVGCAEPTASRDSTSLYALVEGVDGVYFYPPLGPAPTPAGTFDATLLDGLSVAIEAEDAAGAVTTLATFDATTAPAVALLAEEERYWVNIPAATYVTDPGKTYRIRARLDGAELGTSVLSPRIFEVLAWNPALPIGVHVRVEGAAVRTVSRTRLSGGAGSSSGSGSSPPACTGCDAVPYPQCWPVPAGWSPDSNGDCQPEPPLYLPYTLETAPRVDGSLPVDGAWCWIQYGSGSQLVARIVNPALGAWCAGTAPNGAPVIVRCYERGYIGGGYYVCPSFQIPKFDGETPMGYINNPSYATSMSDGYNPDGCRVYNQGTEETVTRCNEIYTAGPRWRCPSGYSYWRNGVIITAGSANPDTCGRRVCPAGTFLTTANVPEADYQHYVCRVTNSNLVPIPSDGVCTAQKQPNGTFIADPRDPDCASRSCVPNGCRIPRRP